MLGSVRSSLPRALAPAMATPGRRGCDGKGRGGRGSTTEIGLPACVGGRWEHKWLRKTPYDESVTSQIVQCNSLGMTNGYAYAVLFLMHLPACHDRDMCRTASVRF